MKLFDCKYRLQTYSDSRFYCRHPRVHARNQLVTPEVCRNCHCHEEKGLPPRPLPDTKKLAILTKPSASEYVTCERLMADVRQFASMLPGNIVGIAGIPRSGMLPASLLAAMLHVPLFEVSPSQGLHRVGHGLRLESGDTPQEGTLLVVDDSICSGFAMRRARTLLAESEAAKCDMLTAAIYVPPQMFGEVDLYLRLAPQPHLFEWNLFNCNQTRHFAFDMDGVICEDYEGVDDDGPDYHMFLRNARPRHLPRRSEVPLVVTARLECYRPATEAWLSRYGIRVRKLVMGPWASAAERRRSYDAGDFKGQAFAASNCRMFIESNERQAKQIFQVARKPVLCASTGEVLR